MLFPFLHSQLYEVNFYSCEKDRIILTYQDQPFEVRLFNLKMKNDNGWEKACRMIQHAEQLQIEIDASSKIQEPLEVYLFVKDELLQEILIRENLAYTMIHNPEYKYEQKLMDLQNAKQVMGANATNTLQIDTKSQGWIFLSLTLFLWLTLVVYAIFHRRSGKYKH